MILIIIEINIENIVLKLRLNYSNTELFLKKI